jgi:hypothetical protein
VASSDLYGQGDELRRVTEDMAAAAAAGSEVPDIAIVLEQVENALKHLAETFGSLSNGVDGREASNELYAVAELCRAAYRQCWSARQGIRQLSGEPE